MVLIRYYYTTDNFYNWLWQYQPVEVDSQLQQQLGEQQQQQRVRPGHPLSQVCDL